MICQGPYSAAIILSSRESRLVTTVLSTEEEKRVEMLIVRGVKVAETLGNGRIKEVRVKVYRLQGQF